MQQILTASWRTKLPKGAVPVGISRGTPRRRGGYRRLRALEPGNWFRSAPPARYTELYRDILDRLDPAEILRSASQLRRLPGDAVLGSSVRLSVRQDILSPTLGRSVARGSARH